MNINQDELDFARDTLGPNATDAEVTELAAERARVAAAERRYVAVVSSPGYLPDTDSPPPTFESAAVAWTYLAEERRKAEEEASDGCSDDVCDPGCPWRSEAMLSDTFVELIEASETQQPGTVSGDTPGYHGDHDLGICYEVVETW